MERGSRRAFASLATVGASQALSRRRPTDLLGDATEELHSSHAELGRVSERALGIVVESRVRRFEGLSLVLLALARETGRAEEDVGTQVDVRGRRQRGVRLLHHGKEKFFGSQGTINLSIKPSVYWTSILV